METILLIVLAVLAGLLLGALVTRVLRSGPDPAADAARQEVAELKSELRHLGERLASDSTLISHRLEGIDERMSRAQATMTSTMAQTSGDGQELFGKIFETLGDVRQATQSVADQAREFSTLQELLKPPKARGGLGETMLQELLRQVLPPRAFVMQHRFSSGAQVDAVVHAGDKLVCIDSKFPLANFTRMCDAEDEIERAAAERDFARDIDGHIRAIKERYIVPDEGTLDFAVMYVPAEGLYGEILRLSHRKRRLFETALEARVIPMSVFSLYGFLQTLLLGLNCLQIEANAQRILDFTGRLHQDIGRFAADYDTLGRHLGNARSKYEDGAEKLDRFCDRLERVVELAGESEERPSLEAVNE